MSATDRTAEKSHGVSNSYTHAYRRELGTEGITNSQDGRKTDDRVNGYLVRCVRTCTIQQQASLARARSWASASTLEWAQRLEVGASEFLLQAAPTVGQLVDYTQNSYKCAVRAMVVHPGNRVKVARVQNSART
jgi:hypothetical protein